MSSRAAFSVSVPARGSGLSRSASLASVSARRTRTPLQYASGVERAVVNSQLPLRVPGGQVVQAGQYRGVQLNKNEENAFRGPVPLSQYQINHDPNPEVIRKRSAPVKYTQKVSVRHLNPPTPAPHGDLVVKEVQRQIPAAPPVVVRQEGRKAATPPPLVYREAPPTPPPRVPTQVVEVEGAPIPPPARKVVHEKLPDQPAKPQNIVIEKWLPYKARTRRVVHERSCIPPPPNPKNLVIEWEQPCVQVEQVCEDLGVCDADPEQYRAQYGCELKQRCEIPDLCPAPCALRSQSCSNLGTLRLNGDVSALRLVDLDRAGLAEYRRFL